MSNLYSAYNILLTVLDMKLTSLRHYKYLFNLLTKNFKP